MGVETGEEEGGRGGDRGGGGGGWRPGRRGGEVRGDREDYMNKHQEYASVYLVNISTANFS